MNKGLKSTRGCELLRTCVRKFPHRHRLRSRVSKTNFRFRVVIRPRKRKDVIDEAQRVRKRITAVLLRLRRRMLRSAEFNKAFVLMQYFGYLRRNPDDAPDANFDGYNFWLGKLNQFNGNFISAEMVKAFIQSIEYRQRFGP